MRTASATRAFSSARGRTLYSPTSRRRLLAPDDSAFRRTCSNRPTFKVATGRAKNLSAFVAEALDQRLRQDELNAILDAMDEEHGVPNKAAVTWAKRVLGS